MQWAMFDSLGMLLRTSDVFADFKSARADFNAETKELGPMSRGVTMAYFLPSEVAGLEEKHWGLAA